MDEGSQSVGARSRRRQRSSVRSSLEDRKKRKESSSSICLQKLSKYIYAHLWKPLARIFTRRISSFIVWQICAYLFKLQILRI